MMMEWQPVPGWEDIMSEWRDIETAPKDGTPFLALNTDHECHVAKYEKYGRICRRSHQPRRPQRFEVRQTDRGEEKVLRDEGFSFDTNWSLWTNGYEFNPTHWMPLPEPPEAA